MLVVKAGGGRKIGDFFQTQLTNYSKSKNHETRLESVSLYLPPHPSSSKLEQNLKTTLLYIQVFYFIHFKYLCQLHRYQSHVPIYLTFSLHPEFLFLPSHPHQQLFLLPLFPPTNAFTLPTICSYSLFPPTTSHSYSSLKAFSTFFLSYAPFLLGGDLFCTL